MATHAKVFSSVIVVLVVLTLMPAPTPFLPAVPDHAPATAAQAQMAPAPLATQDEAATQVRLEQAFGHLPLYFVENQGQMDERVSYYVRGSDKMIYFTAEGLTFVLSEGTQIANGKSQRGKSADRDSPFRYPQQVGDSGIEAGALQRWAVKLEFIGTKAGVRPVGEEQQEAVISYFKGQPEEWRTGLPTYSRIVYRDLWPGIDLAYYGTVDRLKYEFIVHPGADPGQIRLAYRGAAGVAVNAAGQLEVETPMGGFADDVPVAYQEIDGQRVDVPVEYALNPFDPLPVYSRAESDDSALYTFHLGPYDRSHPLVIDPVVLVYCGYIGGSGSDSGERIAVDEAGNAYAVGYTASSEALEFPVTVGPDLTHNGSSDAFVAKINAAGTELVYAGYIGGSGEDYGSGIAVDRTGNVYVVGSTRSGEAEGFPVTAGPDLTYNGGDWDAFVAKVNAAGTALAYCGYIGGSSWEYGYGIAVDRTGNAYVVGGTTSSEAAGFPVTVGPDLAYNGGDEYGGDAFVAKVNAAGTALAYCGYIGGSSWEYGDGIAVDRTGNAYVVGSTRSGEAEGFPVMAGPDLTYNGSDLYGGDAFVAKVNAAGTALVYCGYIGGSDRDWGCGIAVDGAGNAYVVGYTWSDEADGFPVTVGPDLTYNGYVCDAFVAKVNAGGTALAYCGYIGGSRWDHGLDIAIDGAGNAYVVGETGSTEAGRFPVTVGPDLTYNGGYSDAYVAKVNAAGTALTYCGYIGGSDTDQGSGIAVDGAGNTYITGYTFSTEATFPVMVGPDLTYNGGENPGDAFAAKVRVLGTALYLPAVLRNYHTWDAYYEENDHWLDAYGPLVSGATYLAYPDDIEDYYYFVLSESVTVTISVTDFAPTSTDGDLLLYGPAVGNERGNLIKQYGKKGHSSMSLGPHSLGPGKYYVRVYTAQGYSTTQLYRLTVTY